MKKEDILLVLLAVLVVGGFLFILNSDKPVWSCYYNKLSGYQIPQPSVTVNGQAEPEVIVSSPQPGEVVASPLEITGQARGGWFFEASFPVKLVAIHGKVLAIGIAQAQGEWMTEDFVDFVAALTFTTPDIDQGELILEKDNPAGLPENAGEFRVPVQFKLE